MAPFFVLLTAFIICLLLLKFIKGQLDYQLAGRVAMAVMLLFTAVGHFIYTEGMSAMIPDLFPAKKIIVLLTGVLEIIFAIGLLIPRFSRPTGWLIIIFFILILPANIKASMESINYQTGELDGNGLSYLWLRIPLQIFFIVWTYFSAIRKINQLHVPFRQKAAANR